MAEWPAGFFVFWVTEAFDAHDVCRLWQQHQDSDCIGRSNILYDSNGALHDAVEQGFHDQNPGEDHPCVDRRLGNEGG
jgi:hypothetical protein